ncbi:MAG: ABC transporter substrate-binding protein [Desulfurococcaceae archaeon]
MELITNTRFMLIIASTLLIGIVIGYTIGYYMGQTTVQTTQTTPIQRKYILGVSIALSGPISSICVQWEPVVRMAIDDLNNISRSMGLNLVFEPYILDDKGSPEEALKNAQTFYAAGIRIMIGPPLSSQLKAIKAFSDANKFIIIAPCSNSPTLAIPGDYIFRTQPSAIAESEALAVLAIRENIRSIISFHIDDEFCNVFSKYFKDSFEKRGGRIVHEIVYSPGQADYGTDVATLASFARSLTPDAILYCGYGTDGANILSHAAEEPALRATRWLVVESFYGASEVLVPKIIEFAQQVRMIGIRPAPLVNPLYDEFVNRLRNYGGTPTYCSENVYDAVMIAGLAVLRTGGSTDPDELREAIVQVAKTYYGPGGWGLLDENGDRVQAAFKLWTLSMVNGTPQYVDIGYISDSTIVMES